jgi:hypothetical protein
MLDFQNLIFAVSDATERFPSASRLLLQRFADSLLNGQPPRTSAGWLEHINSVFAGQSYHQKATLSCVALERKGKTVRAHILHGGDSVVFLINLKTKLMEYRTSPDMYFAGRAKGLLSVDEVEIESEDYGLVIASDGIADPARFSGHPLEKITGPVLARLSLHEIPEGLTRFLAELSGPHEYDDIGIIALSPTRLQEQSHSTILIGGTSAVEENTYQKKLAEGNIPDAWLPINAALAEGTEGVSGVQKPL